jgi:hypothetical protein
MSGASAARVRPPPRPIKIHSVTSIASSLVCRHHGGTDGLTSTKPNADPSLAILDPAAADRRPNRGLLGAAALALIARGRCRWDPGAGILLDGL